MMWQERFASEMAEIDALMKRELQFRQIDVQEFFPLEMDEIDRSFCPALVFSLGEIWGQSHKDMVHLAITLEYTFLAHKVHRILTEEEIPRELRQYAVLVGDLFFGLAFSKLCQGKLFRYFGDFIELIKRMNEGFLLRWRAQNTAHVLNEQELKEILDKEKGCLAALIVRILADLGEVSEEENQRAAGFAHEMGLAWAAQKEPEGESIFRESMSKGESLLRKWKNTLAVERLTEFHENVFRCVKSEFDLLLPAKTCKI